jgi:type II secretion system protein D
MRITRNSTGQRLLFLGLLLVLAVWAVGAYAVDPEKTPAPGGPAAPPERTDIPPKQPEKKITFEMRDKPWIGEKGSVLEWFSDQTGMPVITSNAKPTGTLTFISPKEKDGTPKQFTIPEVVDVLNDELFKQKYILIRRAKSWTIIPADEKIDAASIPRVLPGELEQYGNTELVSFVVPVGSLSAEEFAKEVETVLGPFGKVQPLKQANKLMVQDTVANLKRVRALVDEQNSTPEVIPLSTQDATEAVETLKTMFGYTGKDLTPGKGSPYLKADTARNAVVAKGTPEQMKEIRTAIKALEGTGGGTAAATMRVITIEGGTADAVAEELQRMLQKLLPQNPVQVITPGGSDTKKPEPSKNEPPPDKSGGKDQAGTNEEQEPQDKDQPPAQGNKSPFVDPQQQPAPQNNQPGAKKPAINIAAAGNKIIITSEDPKALAVAAEAVRMLTQGGTEGNYETIRLNKANATEAAKALDEAFNGPRQQNQNQQGGGFGGPGGGRGGGFGNFFSQFAAPGATPPATPRKDTIRVVAYPPTNTLLVRASRIDMLRIRQLLKNAIDPDEPVNSSAVVQTWMLKRLQYANATEVANVIRDVYREHLNANPSPTQLEGFGGFRFRGRGGSQQNLNVDANGNPRAVDLSVGVDNRSNRLIVSCSKALYEDIQTLVTKLDEAAKDSTRTVKVVSIKGVDPVLVQQAIDAIQGRRPVPQSGNTGPGFGSGRFSTPGGTGGGFNPGMFFPRGGGGGPGGGPPGGGGFPGGGGPPGGGRSSSTGGSRQSSRGPDFFAQRVKDDPQPSLFYDPQQPSIDGEQQTAEKPASQSWASESSASSHPIQLTKLEVQQPPTTGPAPDIQGPRSPVTAEALEQLGVVVIQGENPADVEAVIKIIEMIQKLAAGAEVEIQLVPLDHADCTSVSNTLMQLFRSVIVNAAGNVRSTQPTATTTTVSPLGTQTSATQQQAASVFLLPLPRYNAILMAAPKARVKDILQEIKRLDRPTSPKGRAIPFSLKKASASRVATLLINWYSQRYPNETLAQHQVRVTPEDSTNTVFVQAAPADLEEIRELIERIDNTVSSAVNELEIIHLRNALASELTTLIVQAISQGIVAPTTTGLPTTTTPGAVPGAVPGGPGGLPRTTGVPGAPGTLPGGLPTGVPGAGVPSAAQTTGTTKTISLRFVSTRPGGPAPIEAGILEDIHITPDARTNSLIIAAPSKTMQLLLALVRELDVPPPARAEVKVFPLRKADAAAMAAMLQQLFFGTGTLPGGTVGGLGGLPGALPGAAGAAIAGVPTAQFTVSGTTPEGAPLIELHITVDARTNSLIVAGGRNDLEVVEALVLRLEDSDVQPRQNEVFHLRNASAADVAATLQTFLNNALAVLTTANQLTAFQEVERAVVIAADPISNKLLVSATPKYFPELARLIEELDAQPPQVVIQVLVAEVDLTSTDEFGVEIGLQSPVLFSRSIIPADNFLGNGTINYVNPGLVPQGVTVNSSINPAALPGFNFNNATNFSMPLGNNPVVNPGIVGFQGLGNLGVGRANSTTGLGGFVFSAASNTFNLLIRALKTQGRIDVLSRPQIQTTDNQTALINIGQDYPYVSSVAVTGTGVVTPGITYRSIGVILQVTPRISPDGTVFMRVIPEVSSVAPTMINLGNNILASAFNVQHVETTVSAKDGETVAIGGLITKRDEKHENKFPWVGDLPYVGALFRYRTQTKSKTELLVILTPHIVRCPMDADRILAEESRRISWILGDVMKVHGTTGLEPILPPHPAAPGVGDPTVPSLLPGAPVPSCLPAGPGSISPTPRETLPTPRPVTPSPPAPAPQPSTAPGPKAQSSAPSSFPAMSTAPSGAAQPPGDPAGTTMLSAPSPQPGSLAIPTVPTAADVSPSTEPPKERRGWILFRRNQQ